MKKALLLLLVISILSTGAGCNGSPSNLDLIALMRQEAYFGISRDEASDQELLMFLHDSHNRIFIEGTVREITFGRKVKDAPAEQMKSAGEQFFSYMSGKIVSIGLEEFLNRLTGYSPLWPIVGTLLTIHKGANIFRRLTSLLCQKEKVYLVHEYVIERGNRKSEKAAYDLTINDPIYENIVELVVGMERANRGKIGEPTEEDREEGKKELWDYCETAYRSWELANNKQKRENIKQYILDWIDKHKSVSPPRSTPKMTISISGGKIAVPIDLNSDGIMNELIVAKTEAPGEIYAFTSDGELKGEPITFKHEMSCAPRHLAPVDYDSDGKFDEILVDVEGSTCPPNTVCVGPEAYVFNFLVFDSDGSQLWYYQCGYYTGLPIPGAGLKCPHCSEEEANSLWAEKLSEYGYKFEGKFIDENFKRIDFAGNGRFDAIISLSEDAIEVY